MKIRKFKKRMRKFEIRGERMHFHLDKKEKRLYITMKIDNYIGKTFIPLDGR
jgi:hypothetical protein